MYSVVETEIESSNQSPARSRSSCRGQFILCSSLVLRRRPVLQAPRSQVLKPRRGSITSCSSSHRPMMTAMIRRSRIQSLYLSDAGFSIGSSASAHARVPPGMFITRVKPALLSVSAACKERRPVSQIT